MNTVVDNLTTDYWTGAVCQEEVLGTPTDADLCTRLNALDAKSKTMVSLNCADGNHMCIGGGNGKYLVYVRYGDKLATLISRDSKSESTVHLNIGGQLGDYPATQIASREQVIQAARMFFSTGRLDSSLKWQLEQIE